MILVGRVEILLRFAGIAAVLSILFKLYIAITSKTFHPGKMGCHFYTAEIRICRDEIFQCHWFSLPKQDEKVIDTLVLKNP